MYHRGYDVDQPEPTKVYLYPSRVEVISYPGPVPGIEPRHLVANAAVRAAPARNRRIGEFLKELGLAADHGFPNAQACLGDMFATGRGVPKDDSEASRWHAEADASRAAWEDSDVITPGFTPYENEDQWDLRVALRGLRELDDSPAAPMRTSSKERTLD